MLRKRRLRETTDSLVSDQQQHDFKIAYRLLNRVNEISWGASALNVLGYALNPLNASQFFMESADLGMARGIGGAANKDKEGQHIVASKRREKIYYMHAGVAAANMPLTYFTWENTSDISPRSLALSATVGFLSMVGLYIDSNKNNNQIDTEQQTDTSVNQSSLIHRQNNVAVRYINGSNLAEASLAIAGASTYGLYDKAPAVATLLTGVTVGALMLKGAFNERSFRSNNLS